MSQQQGFGTSSGGGSIPGNVPQIFVLDDGSAVPNANTLNVNGLSSSESNDNGILTRANPDLSENAEVVLTNRMIGTATTSGASTEDLVTFPLAATVTSYRLQFDVIGRETTTGDTVGYSVDGTVKTDGATASLVATPFYDKDEDPSLIDAEIALVVSGNNAVLQVTGVAATAITYKAVGIYVAV